MPKTKVYDREKENRKAEATKIRSWAYKNLSILVASAILPSNELPTWIDCIRKARMLEDIQAIWVTTEVMIKTKAPDAKTACDEEKYERGLRNLVALSMSGQTSNRGGR
jgi:hypothetical protein